MECKFVVGQKVASKVDFENPVGCNFVDLPRVGQVFTISDIQICSIFKIAYLKFKEKNWVGSNGIDFNFRFDCFAPVETKPTSIEIFKKMLNNKTMPKELENV